MTYLGLSRSSVEKKRSGERSMSPEEAAAFSSLWHDIRAFRIRDLPAGAVEMAYATLILTGRRAPEQKSRGRKRLVPLDPAVEAETKRQRNLAAMAEAIAGIAAKREEKKAERKANRQTELDALMSAVRRPDGEA